MRFKRGIFLVGFAAAMIGCGGGGTFETGSYPNTYRGTYSGTWTSSSLNEGGAISFTITDNGALNGTMARKASSGNLVGTVDKTGRVYATAGSSGGAGTYIISGTMTFESGHLLCNFNFTFLGIEYGGNFDTTSSSSSSS